MILLAEARRGAGARVAIPHYQDALRVRPGYATAQFDLAVALRATGRPAEASTAAERALALARQSGKASLVREITRCMAGTGC